MTSPYTPRPALKIDSGIVVFLNVQKRFPGFLRCNALHFLNANEFQYSELAPSPAEFRNAIAKLPSNPILGPLSGGVSMIMYLAARGLEEDFKDLADEIAEVGLSRLFDLPSREMPVVVIFGNAEAMEDQALNPQHQGAPVPVKQEPAPQPVAPPLPPVEVKPPEPEPAPTPPPVELPPPVSVPTPSAVPAPEASVQEPAVEPALPIVAAPPQPEPAPEPAPIPESEPMAASAAVAEPEPVVPLPEPPPAHQPVAPPAPVVAAPTIRPPAALALGSDYYALRTPDTGGSTVMVWQARKLTSLPNAREFEILQPTADTYERLITDARDYVHYTDEGRGELVAIKLAVPEAEAESERALNVLLQIGTRALRLYYPASIANWSSDFPGYVVEWVSGASVTDSPAFSEANALELSAQILELLAAARSVAPEIVLTSGLKASNVIVSFDERGSAHARIIDWNDYAPADADGARTMQRRLGELMADLFTDLRDNFDELSQGGPDDPVTRSWDSLSYLTRDLIHTALHSGFEGDADAVIAAMTEVVNGQRKRWAESDPLWNARLAEAGAERLTWLDIAAAKQGGLSNQASDRLNTQRADEMKAVAAWHTEAGRYDAAIRELRTAVRRHPAEAYFRWALLANLAAALGPEAAFQRLRLQEALNALRAGNHNEARNTLDHGTAHFDDLQFDPANRERARDAVLALSMAAQSLALCDAAMNALNESWNVEDAEAKLALAEDRLARYEKLAAGVVTGRDPVCAARIAAGRTAINEFYTKHGRYDPYAARRETTEQARRANFGRLVERAAKLAESADRPDGWNSALMAYDRAAAEFPDLWKDDHEQQRVALIEKVARRRLAEAKQLLGQGNWNGAGSALAVALQCPATSGEAARLQSALWAYQRAEVELQRGENSAALASFIFAADHSDELRPRAEGRAQALRDQGAAAGGDALSRELTRRFADQQGAMGGMVQNAVLAAQQQGISRQVDSLRELLDEQGKQATAAQATFADEQERRIGAALTRMRQELGTQQDAAVRQSLEDQLTKLRGVLVTLHDEDKTNQEAALEALKKEQAKHFEDLRFGAPDWFSKAQREEKKLRDEQEEKLAAALKSVEATMEAMRASAAKAETAALEQTAATPAPEASVQELSMIVADNTSNLKSLQGRLGVLTFLNVLLLVCLLGVLGTAGAFAFLPNFRAMLPQVEAATSAPVPPTTAPVAGATPPVAAPTAAGSVDAISCAGIDQARAFFDCTVTNPNGPAELNLMVKPLQGDVQGFFYSVSLNGQSLQPVASNTPGETWFNLGSLSAGESMPVRVTVACVAAGGCNTTAFMLQVAGSDGETPLGNVQVMSPP